MSEVKRVEAKGVLRELKLFAFEGNHDFQHGFVSGVETQKSFIFPTQPVLNENGDFDISYQKTVVGFRAARLGKIRNHNNYDYELYATSERSIPRIPEHIMSGLLDADEESDEIDEMDMIRFEEGEIAESTTITLGASDDTIGQIVVGQSYEVSVNDNKIFEHSDDDIFYDVPGTMVDLPSIESEFEETKRFVPEPINHERLPIDEHLLNEIAFRAILSPFMHTEYMAVIGFRDAAERMRVIMDVMRNGAGVRRLYDEVK